VTASSRRTKLTLNPMLGSYNRATLFLALQVGGVSKIETINYARESLGTQI
jgi:hypothetical protein